MFLLKGNNNLIINTVWSLHRSYPVWDANRSQTVFASAFRYGEYLRYVSTPTAECASLYSADSHVCRLRPSRVTCVRGSVVVCRATGETRHSHESLNTRFSSEPFYNFTKQFFFFLTSAADSHLNLSTITRSKPPSIPPQSGEFCFNLLDVSLSVSFSSFAHTDVADL